MTQTWDADAAGVMLLPSGRLIRGRGLARPLPEGPAPAFALYLLGDMPPSMPWPARWVTWPDFRLPADPLDARDAFGAALAHAAYERVEVAYVREHYRPTAVETARQQRFVRGFR